MTIFMRNKLIVSFLLLVSRYALAIEFPKLCPSAENLPQICEQLSKIDPASTLVFSDGYEMPACFVISASNRFPEQLNKEKAALRRIAKKLFQKKDLNPAAFDIAIQKPTLGKKMFPELSADFDAVIEARVFIEKNWGEAQGKTIPIEPVISNAVAEIYDLINSRPTTFLSFLNSKGNFKSKLGKIRSARSAVPAQKLSCRPDVNAFFYDDLSIITITDNLAQHPPLSRIATLGHEVGHSIDACESGSGIFPSHPTLSKLVDCFQKDVGKFSTKLRLAAKPNCDPHKREVICDYLGVYTLEQYLKKHPPQVKRNAEDVNAKNRVVMPKGYDAIFTALDLACFEPPGFDDKFSDHPSSMRRLKEIYLRNPTILKNLNCPVDPKAPYCDAEKGLVNGSSLNAPNADPTKDEIKNNYR